MFNKDSLELPSEIGDMNCSREDFMMAKIFLDGVIKTEGLKEMKFSVDSLEQSLEEYNEGTKTKINGQINQRVSLIIYYASKISSKNSLILGKEGTSEGILTTLDKSGNTKFSGIAQIVREKIDGIIGSASGNKLLAASNAVQKGFPEDKFLSLELILLLGKIQLQKYCMTDLAKFLGKSTASVTGNADRLEKLGYVKRNHDPDDRRKIFLTLTKKGQQFIEMIQTELTR